jgi:hypothetical protein
MTRVLMLAYHTSAIGLALAPGDIGEFDDLEAARQIEIGGARALSADDEAALEDQLAAVEQAKADTSKGKAKAARQAKADAEAAAAAAAAAIIGDAATGEGGGQAAPGASDPVAGE